MNEDTIFYQVEEDNGGGVIEIPSMKKLNQMLTAKFNYLNYKIEYLKKENEKLKEKNWKDNQLQEIKAELARVKEEANLGFRISKEDHKKAINWIMEHEEEVHHSSEKMYPRGGAIGGSYTWKFVPTSIGTFGSVQCICGEEFCFQEEW